MRRTIAIGMAAALLVAMGAQAASAGGNGSSFSAHLQGGNEAPPNDSQAQGQAHFRLHKGDLQFKLIVANIDDVFAAHIHCGAAGINGPVGVTLFSGGPTSDNGLLASGVIDEPNPGNVCGWTTVDDILAALGSGDAYVNVHTLDVPSGEIRGQVK